MVRAGTMEGKVLLREVESDSVEGVRSMLDKDGLLPLEIRRRGFSVPSFLSRAQKVRGIDMLVFNQGLLTLLKAGLPIIEALETLKSATRNTTLSKALDRVQNDLKAGKTISEAFLARPEAFPALYASNIAAGEKTGDLIPAIIGYIDFQKRTEEIRKKVFSSALYPLILAASSLAVVGFLLYFVVPSFAEIYLSSGAQLPLGTRVLISAAGFMQANIIFLAILAAGLFFLLRSYLRTDHGRELLDTVKLRCPQLGGIYEGYSLAKFSRTLGMLLKSGVPLPEALAMSKGVLGNRVHERKLSGVIKSVIGGGSASAAMSACALLPEITFRMFSAGEKSASLQSMLDEIAIFHEGDIDYRVGILTGFLEPALMIIMGLVIGGIVVLMYMPIFQLGAGF